MAVKRVVSTDFWNDQKVMDMFSPEDKLFFLYLLTNPHTTQLGIYSINQKHMAMELGYSVDVINVLLDRFENAYGLIKYSPQTKEIAVKNYLRHSIVKGGKPVEDCLKKEIAKVKDKSLMNFVYEAINNSDDLNSTVKSLLPLLRENENDKDNENDNDNDNERIVPRIVQRTQSCVDVCQKTHPSDGEKQTKKKTVSRKDVKTAKTPYFQGFPAVDVAFEEYIESRKKMKKAMSESTIERNVKKLQKYATVDGVFDEKTAIEILNNSVDNNWIGIFPLKTKTICYDDDAGKNAHNNNIYGFGEKTKSSCYKRSSGNSFKKQYEERYRADFRAECGSIFDIKDEDIEVVDGE